MTLRALLLIFAAVDLAICVIIATALMRRQQELPVAQQGPQPKLILIAGFVAAIMLCVLSFYLPDADRLIV